jgi:hypothetical protein
MGSRAFDGTQSSGESEEARIMPPIELSGRIEKMRVRPESPVEYELPLGDDALPMNPLLGKTLRIEWGGEIRCTHCGRKTKTSFGQGHCFPCFQQLARCDSCIVKPELCHYDQGTCREPEWGEAHCLIPHTVYLANSSGLKVGITRGTDPRTRWIDQGASQGLAIRTVPTRLASGTLEVALKDHVADKTNWRKMLKATPEALDLAAERDRLLAELEAARPGFDTPGHALPEAVVATFDYPVLQHPEKIISHNLHKKPEVEGQLLGIKGQYLIFDTGVINMRKYGGYVLRVIAGD